LRLSRNWLDDRLAGVFASLERRALIRQQDAERRLVGHFVKLAKALEVHHLTPPAAADHDSNYRQHDPAKKHRQRTDGG
jgi:hypothetical protein